MKLIVGEMGHDDAVVESERDNRQVMMKLQEGEELPQVCGTKNGQKNI